MQGNNSPKHEPLEAVLERLERRYNDVHASSSLSVSSEAPNSATASTSSNATSTGNSSTSNTTLLPEDGTLARTNDPDVSMLPLLAAICLIPHNKPDDFAILFRYFAASTTGKQWSSSLLSNGDKSSSNDHDEVIPLSRFVLRLRTALFKAVPLVGVPRIINALSALQSAVLSHPSSSQMLAKLPVSSSKPTKTTEEDSAAGWSFFKAIYAQHAEGIIKRIGETSPDLAEMIVDELYGANLSRREVLSWKETVLIEFTGCASLACSAQAKGHFFGCKNLGVPRKSIELALEVLREIGTWIGQELDEEEMPFIKHLDKFER